MSDTGKPSVFRVKKARDARVKRLEIRRMMDNFKSEIGSPFVGAVDCCGRKRRIGLKEVPSCETLKGAGEDSKIDKGGGNLTYELSPSASSSQSLEGSAGDGVNVEEKSNTLSCLSHGSISMIGRRRLMEDAVSVEPGIVAGEFAFFAVYDGHGGSRVANACRERLHRLLATEIEGRKIPDEPTDGGGIDWEKVMMACFANMDEEVSGGADGSEFEMQNGTSVSVRTIGSTAVVVMVGKKELVVANCGDSRAVLCRGGTAVPLSHDHKVASHSYLILSRKLSNH
ncbi:hypothetical protein F0562_035511 [Nyssa sinensis]|uniref:protein-serine/threonine phosphatase n=1 Tax=Nyssa sinensis TaxID=561372 RepID=A0A5J5ADK5_9ASTE|nr:hypothetical protein F0562_035511 [Nyssa sinensis]